MTKKETQEVKHIKEEIAILRKDVNEMLELLHVLATLAKAMKWIAGVGAGFAAIFKFTR